MKTNIRSASYLRNFIFGVEDSLVSTVGLLSGIAIADLSRETIFLTGIVLIFVEAISMAAGTYLSEYSADGYLNSTQNPSRQNLVSGIIMLFSYFISGFVPLLPYILWPVSAALPLSIIFSLIALFTLGIIGARISKTGIVKNGFRMAIIGGMAIAVGLVAGKILSGGSF